MKVNDDFYCHYRSQLADIADKLTLDLSCPIDIVPICDNLNISITKDTNSTNKAVLVESNNKIGIALSKNYYDNLYSPFVRHILAHEVGHYFLHYQIKATITKNEYWLFEELCDYFSRSLLIPKSNISEKAEELSNDLRQLLFFSRYISKSCNVTWITSISRLKDLIDNLLFINFKSENSTNKFIANKSLLSKHKYLNTSLNMSVKQICKYLGNKSDNYLLKKTDPTYLNLKQKFPEMFLSCSNEIILVFRPRNIAIMTLKDAQQLHSR